MNEYELKVIEKSLEENSNKISEAIKGCSFNLARIYNALEKIEVLLSNQQKQLNDTKDRTGIIK